MPGWTRVPNDLIERSGELGHATFAVYAAIAMHADGAGVCWPSIRSIVSITRCCTRTVLRAIEALEAAGFLEVTRGVKENGSRNVNLYKIPHWDSDTTKTPPPVRVMTPGKQGSDTRKTPLFSSCHQGVFTGKTEQDPRTRSIEQDPLNKKGRKAAGDVAIPSELDSDAFRAAWKDWTAYRRERRLTCTARTLTAQLAKLASWGPTAAVDAIQASIANGWQGLFPPKASGHTAAPVGMTVKEARGLEATKRWLQRMESDGQE